MALLFSELSLAAQTAFAELSEQARVMDLESLAGLTGAFHRRTIKGRPYVYFGYRDPLGNVQRRIYVGPADERVNALVARFEQSKAPKRLAPNAQAAMALGCAGMVPKHYRIVRQLSRYGFFRAGGVLIGTHAFQALGNQLGARWANPQTTLDVDFAHAGRNVELALPADVKLSVHDALTSLELGLLPLQELSGTLGAHYRNPRDPELRVDFLTAMTRDGKPVTVESLGLVLEPLKFMDYLLEGTTQTAILSRDGACLVNVPAPARLAVHKLIVSAERKGSNRAKAVKDLEQAAALSEWCLFNDARAFREAWMDAIDRGRGWGARAKQGRLAMLERHPALDAPVLWGKR